MSGIRHTSKTRVINPGFKIKEHCQGHVGLGREWERPCYQKAHWLYPDSGHCAIHMTPHDLIELERRAGIWAINMEEIYNEILALRTTEPQPYKSLG